MATAGPAKPASDRLPDGLTWHGYLVQLLHIASSIEHALMVQYLYAAYSLDERPDLDPAEREKIPQWRNLILSVAKEEMGHLITVQNVLCLLGGQMDLVRENYPFDSAFYPFRFCLEPLSIGSLACYVYCEMGERPSDEDPVVNEVFELAAKHLSRREADKSPTAAKRAPTAEKLREPNAHQVGALYVRMMDILRDHKKIPDALFSYNSVRFQASPDEWGRGYGIGKPSTTPSPASQSGQLSYQDLRQKSEDLRKKIEAGATHAAMMIEAVATRQQAIDALNQIAVQGEGHGIEPECHFMRFRSIMEDFLKFRERDKNWQPSSLTVAENPLISWPDVPDDPTGNRITHPLSEKWGNMLNLRYRMLLTYLSHSFRLARDGTEARLRGAVIHRVFAEMYNIKAIAGILVRLPLTHEKGDERRAGPPFQMPYTLAISMDPVDRWRQQADLLTGALDLNRDVLEFDLSDRIKSNCNPTSDPDFLHSNLKFLRAMRDLDCQSHAWITKVITGMAPEEGPRP